MPSLFHISFSILLKLGTQCKNCGRNAGMRNLIICLCHQCGAINDITEACTMSKWQYKRIDILLNHIYVTFAQWRGRVNGMAVRSIVRFNCRMRWKSSKVCIIAWRQEQKEGWKDVWTHSAVSIQGTIASDNTTAQWLKYRNYWGKHHHGLEVRSWGNNNLQKDIESSS